jgi:hypothetical protein
MTIIDTYYNTLYPQGAHLPCYRWTCAPDVSVGGSILGPEDWKHLRDDLGMGAVVNVETEHDDEGKGIEHLLQCRVPDDGSPFPLDYVRQVVSFAKVHLSAGRKVHVHCQGGGSRSPAFAYAMLRWCHKLSPVGALEAIRGGKGDVLKAYGMHPYHISYISSVEGALGQ